MANPLTKSIVRDVFQTIVNGLVYVDCSVC